MIDLTERQSKFYIKKTKDIDEILFGGAAGGGKSFALIADVYEYLKLPKSNALLFRRTFPELQESIINKCFEFYPEDAYNYNEGKKVMTFKNGSRLKFGYLEAEKDKFRYQGGEWSYIGFDELTHFSETQYLYLKSRNRNTKGYPNVIRCTSNPGGTYHEWVKKRFISPGEPNKIHEIVDVLKGKEYRTKILYIPSLLKDNPHIDEDEYTKNLLHLPDAEREALLNGNWDLVIGDVFTREHFRLLSYEEFQEHIKTPELDEIIEWELAQGKGDNSLINYMTVDVAVTNSKTSDSSAFTMGCIDSFNKKYVKKSKKHKLLSNELLEQTLKYAKDYEVQFIGVEDTAISKTFIENLEQAILDRGLPYIVIRLSPKGRNKEARIQQYILSSYNQYKLFFVDIVDEELISEAINFPNAIHNDALDSLAYFIEMGDTLLARAGGLSNRIEETYESEQW